MPRGFATQLSDPDPLDGVEHSADHGEPAFASDIEREFVDCYSPAHVLWRGAGAFPEIEPPLELSRSS